MSTDFNVARLETDFDANEFGGTLPYMAPEHLRAYQAISGHSSDDVDVRSDIYSLGIMLLELLSGHKTWGELPADGERLIPALLAQRLGGLPDVFARGIRPRSLRGVLSKCLAAQPDQRYQSAGDLAADLNAWLEGRSLIHAERKSVPTRVVGLLPGRGLRGARGAMVRLTVANQIASLSPANVDAAFQYEALDDAADPLLSSMASEFPGVGLRGLGRHFRE
jgi:serine/threonine protein kinase